MVDSAVKTQIDSEINFNWGTSAITRCGTDYVSIRWEGKIKPPYNETYTFYIYADVCFFFLIIIVLSFVLFNLCILFFLIGW